MRFRNLIADLAQTSLVILSSHIVSDIETIADRIAIMKGGQLLAQGTQEDIIRQADGKVFEMTIDSTAMSTFKMEHQVVNTRRQNGQTHVRFMSDHDVEGATPAVASLEDAYLYLTHTH